jgi:RsiW-degrading membrane proteinase PrsW (M82 family)
LHFPIGSQHWPTTWRRFTLALVSGATQAIVFASIFELILSAIAIRSLGVTGFSLNNPDQPIPSDPRAIGFLLILVSVIAPFVEEAVKPLAVVIMIGRVRTASEAFVLGLASGIGFDLIETSGYISQGYSDWLNVAIQRSSAGLLHGLGAAMVTLGWYYLTHPKESKQPFLLAVGCWGYAVLQHAIWNGSFVLQLLPAPIGPYLTNGVINIGIISIPAFILVYIVETALMLTFLVFVTGRLRRKPPVETTPGQAQNMPNPNFQGAGARV